MNEPKIPIEDPHQAGCPAATCSALVDMAIADYVAMLERQNKYLRKELHKNEARLKWLHDCSTGQTDPEGYEWGIYRVKWENGQAVSVMQTNSDLSDLDAEMARELNTPNAAISDSPTETSTEGEKMNEPEQNAGTPEQASSLHEVDMPRERWIELMANDDLQLTLEEMAGGWHWCNDYDGLLVGPGMSERENCCCFAEGSGEAGHIAIAQRPADNNQPKTTP